MGIYFNYNLLFYLITHFEQVYHTSLVGAGSEIFSYVFSGCLYERLGVKKSYLISLGISIMGAVLIIVYGLDHQRSLSFLVFFMLTRFGLSSAFNLIVVSNS